MLVGRSGMSPVMVGRDAELDRLAALLDQAATPAIALVSGEPGIGKSRLIRELTHRVSSDTLVLVGQADPGALGRPFEVILDVVCVALASPSSRHELERLVDTIVDGGAPSDLRLRAAVDLVTTVVGGRQAIVVVEDLHWADSESITVFERLAESSSSSSLLLLGTYRPDEVTRRHPLAELLPRLERRHSVAHLRLERLSPADVGAFLQAVTGESPSYRVVESLHARTGGNPFFLEELVKGADGQSLDGLCEVPLPWNLAEAIRNQLGDLAAHERRVVEAAAVLGRKIPFDLLATVTRTTETELIDILRDLVAQGLLVETDDDLFSFRHALAREAIQAELLGRERRRIHEAALQVLQDAGSTDFVAIANHASGAGRYDDLVDAACRGSAESLAAGSTYQALQLAELGLREAEGDALADLLSVATRAAWLVGLVDDATEHAEHWLALGQSTGDLEMISAALRASVRLAWDKGDQPQVEATTSELVDLLAKLAPSEEQARAMAAVAQSHMLQSQADAAIEWAERAISLADELELDAVRVGARLELASAKAMATAPDDAGRSVLSQVTQSLHLLLEVAAEAEELGEHVVAARALNNALFCARRLPADETHVLLERMRSAAERAGFDALATANYAEGQAMVAELRGDLDGARAALDAGQRTGRGLVMPALARLDYHGHAAGLALEAGDLDRAAELLAMLESVNVDPTKGAPIAGLAFHLACRRGDRTKAEAELTRFLAQAGHRPDSLGLESTHDLVSAGLAAGFTASSLRRLLTRFEPEAGEGGDAQGAEGAGTGEPSTDTGPATAAAAGTRGVSVGWRDQAWWALIEGQLAEAEGRNDHALAAYRSAIEQGEGSLFPHHLATGHVGSARTLLALDRLEEARAEIEVACRLLAQWGGWRRQEADAVARRLGMGEPVDGPASLTPREREVVALLAEGLSNAELAERLYISPKTAAVHVSNILAKLGMGSRIEVAAWAIRADVDASR